MKKILYIPGYGSGTFRNEKVQALESLGFEVEVLDTKGAWTKAAYVDALEELSKVEYAFIAGSSLGGFWAYWFAGFQQRECILFNPSIRPHETLQSRSLEIAETYSPAHTSPIENAPVIGTLVLLSDKDSVLDHKQALEFFTDRAIIKIIDSDDHTMNSDTDKYLESIKQFIQSESAYM